MGSLQLTFSRRNTGVFSQAWGLPTGKSREDPARESSLDKPLIWVWNSPGTTETPPEKPGGGVGIPLAFALTFVTRLTAYLTNH